MPAPSDTVNPELLDLPDYSTLRFEDIHCETQNALLATALALRAFHLEHGAYPPKLQALCPRYLARIPADPFQPASPLRYKLVQTGAQSSNPMPYLLYSVGPDGLDQRGSAIRHGSGPSPAAQQEGVTATQNSIGDIVAGFNR